MVVFCELAGDPPQDAQKNATETASKCASIDTLTTVMPRVETSGTGEAMSMETMQENHNDQGNSLSPADVGRKTPDPDGSCKGDIGFIVCDRFGNDQTFFGSADAIRSQSPTKHASNKSDEHRQEK
jgi:hypothetical protein